jgi:hypothetical protein
MNYIQYINNFSKKEIERKLTQMSDYMETHSAFIRPPKDYPNYVWFCIAHWLQMARFLNEV